MSFIWRNMALAVVISTAIAACCSRMVAAAAAFISPRFWVASSACLAIAALPRRSLMILMVSASRPLVLRSVAFPAFLLIQFHEDRPSCR